MPTDEELEKTLKETENTLALFEKISGQVADIEKKNETFERDFGFSVKQASEALGRLNLTPEERRKSAEEEKFFNEELARDMTAAEEQFRRERMVVSDSKPAGVRRRVRNMI
jgi:hypothetical protein